MPPSFTHVSSLFYSSRAYSCNTNLQCYCKRGTASFIWCMKFFVEKTFRALAFAHTHTWTRAPKNHIFVMCAVRLSPRAMTAFHKRVLIPNAKHITEPCLIGSLFDIGSEERWLPALPTNNGHPGWVLTVITDRPPDTVMINFQQPLQIIHTVWQSYVRPGDLSRETLAKGLVEMLYWTLIGIKILAVVC